MVAARIYTKSFGATVVSLCGYGLIALGITSLFSGMVLEGIIMVVLGFALAVWASNINDNKRFKLWLKHLQEKNLLSLLQTDVNFAISAYNACPVPKTLEYIRTVNPTAGKQIAEQIAENNQKKK